MYELAIDPRILLDSCGKAFMVSGEPTNAGLINKLLYVLGNHGTFEPRAAMVPIFAQHRDPIKEITSMKGLIIPASLFERSESAGLSLLTKIARKDVNDFMKGQDVPAMTDRRRNLDEEETDFVIVPVGYLEKIGLLDTLIKIGTDKIKQGQDIIEFSVTNAAADPTNSFNPYDPNSYSSPTNISETKRYPDREPRTPYTGYKLICDVDTPIYMSPLVEQAMTTFDCPQKDSNEIKAATVLNAIERSQATRRWVAAKLDTSSVYIMADSETVRKLRDVDARKKTARTSLSEVFKLSKPPSDKRPLEIIPAKFPESGTVFLATNNDVLARRWNVAHDALDDMTQTAQTSLTAPSSGIHNE